MYIGGLLSNLSNRMPCDVASRWQNLHKAVSFKFFHMISAAASFVVSLLCLNIFLYIAGFQAQHHGAHSCCLCIGFDFPGLFYFFSNLSFVLIFTINLVYACFVSLTISFWLALFVLYHVQAWVLEQANYTKVLFFSMNHIFF